MKKIYIAAIAVMALSAPAAMAQDYSSTSLETPEEEVVATDTEEVYVEEPEANYAKTPEKKSYQLSEGDFNRIWGKGRYTRLGYAAAETGAEFSAVQKGKFGLFLQKGTTFLFPKQPFFNMLKVGFDVVWMDMQFSKYNSGYSESGWTSSIEGDYDSDDSGFDMSKFDVGHMALAIGLGIGPNVSVAPFSTLGIRELQPLRASLYFHYAPTVQLYMVSEDGDVELSTSFMNMFTFGGNLRWKWIGVGVEGHWGQAKFKPVDFDSLIGEGDGEGSTKYLRKMANTRVYLQFTF